MAKTALELVIEAARIMQGITGANLALTPNNEMYLQMPDPGTLQRTAQAWLKAMNRRPTTGGLRRT